MYELATRLRFTVCIGVIVLASACGAQPSTGNTNCTPKHTFSTVEKGVLTVVGGDFLPSVSIDQQTGAVSGADGDIINQVAKTECLKLKASALAASALLGAVQSGRADIALGGWYRTAKRAEVLGLTIALYSDYTAILSKTGYSTVSDLKGKTVAVVQGTLFVSDLQKALGSDRVKLYQDADAAFQDVALGRADAWVGGVGEAALRLKQRPDYKLVQKRFEADPALPWTQSVGEANLPYNKDNKDLGKALNDDLRTLRDNGTLKQIIDKWHLPPADDTKKLSDFDTP